MIRIARAGAVMAAISVAVAVAVGVRVLPAVRADEPAGRDIPPAFAPLEYLIGQWKGQAMPKDSAQSFRGWPETHTWAWIFTRGQPSAMSVVFQGSKTLAEGRLSFEPSRKRYRLEGKSPSPRGGSIAFEGAIDASGKMLVLEQVAPGRRESSDAGGGTIRLSFRPNANFIRYTMGIDLKDAGAVQFHRATEVGLTKEGESLAGGSSASDRPRCIVTGGAAAMTMTYQGQSYPICCTGCRDEFNENPEKYIKKASLMAQSRGKVKAATSGPAQVSRFEDAFSGDLADAPSTKPAGRTSRAAPAKAPSDQDSDADEGKSAGRDATAAKKPGSKAASTSSTARAASLLRIAQNLEKSGKTRAALEDYRRIVKDFANSPAATTARQRIKALEKP